jgi:hypothetical protein
MKTISPRPVAVLAAALASLTFASSALAKTWTIDRSGSYKLSRNFTVNSGDAILITASDVALDLNGFKIETRAPGTGRGIVVQNAKGVSIKGGMLGGFNANVALTTSQNVRVDGLQITGGGLAPSGGPSEIGILLINSWACDIKQVRSLIYHQDHIRKPVSHPLLPDPLLAALPFAVRSRSFRSRTRWRYKHGWTM